MARESQIAPAGPAEIKGRADNEEIRDGIELPHELVGQFIELGQRRAAVWDTLLELLAQHLGLGSTADLDDATREDLEEELEELIVEACEED